MISSFVLLFLVSYLLLVKISTSSASNIERPQATGISRKFKQLFERNWEFPTNIEDVKTKLSRFDVIVPVIGWKQSSWFKQRNSMFEKGVYPGVEYRIMQLDDVNNYTTTQSVSKLLTIRPAYRLIPELERAWPIIVSLDEIPTVFTKGMYNTATVLVSSSLSFIFFSFAWIISCMFTLSVVNSKSMEPVILPHDVILVEKVSPAINRLFHQHIATQGDILFFTPPPKFKQFIEMNEARSKIDIPLTSEGVTDDLVFGQQRRNSRSRPKLSSSSLLIKRVNALTSNKPNNQQAQSTPPQDIINKAKTPSDTLTNGAIKNDEVCFDMRGDNVAVSVDSRDWGCLPSSYVVGRPVLRLLPLSRIGIVR